MITFRDLCMYDEALHAYAHGVADTWTRLVVGWHVLWCRDCRARIAEHRRFRTLIVSAYGFAAAKPTNPLHAPVTRKSLTMVLAAVMLALLAVVAVSRWDDIKAAMPWSPHPAPCHECGTSATAPPAKNPTLSSPAARPALPYHCD